MLASEYGISVSFDTPLAYRGYASANRITNPSFESSLGTTWVTNTDGGAVSVARSTEKKNTGSYSCKVIASSITETQNGGVYQTVSVNPSSSYYLEYWSIVGGDGSWQSQGRYGVYDASTNEWILTKRNSGAFSAQNWTRVADVFNTGPNTTSIRLYLYQGMTAATAEGAVHGENWVYYDDVSLLERALLRRSPAPDWGGSGRLGSYRHTSSVNVGFDNMSLTTAGTEAYIGDWFEHGLGRRALVTSPSGVIWEGFVNEISANLGGSVLTLGPLLDVINRGRIIYKEMNWNTTPPVGGDTVRGEWVDLLESQERFGILEGQLTGAEGTTDEMAQLIQTMVPVSAWPEIAQNVNIGGEGNLDLTITCLGYGHLFKKQFYTETSVANWIDVSEKISRIVDYDPNHIFSVGNAIITPNDVQIRAYENSDRTSLDILKELVALGDTDYNRYVFGIFENRKFSYWNATALEPKYFWSMRTNRIQLSNTTNVEPFEVRPGQWVRITDLMAGKPSFDVDARTDPRFMFLESVTYSAPYSLSMTGGRASTFRQKIERLGLGGM